MSVKADVKIIMKKENLKELNDPKKIEEFINPFINLSYEIKNYGLYDKKIELKR